MCFDGYDCHRLRWLWSKQRLRLSVVRRWPRKHVGVNCNRLSAWARPRPLELDRLAASVSTDVQSVSDRPRIPPIVCSPALLVGGRLMLQPPKSCMRPVSFNHTEPLEGRPTPLDKGCQRQGRGKKGTTAIGNSLKAFHRIC